MTPTTQQFKWVDRDTAARDLLQVAYHAPDYISTQAWELLPLIGSTALIPELMPIALDKEHPHSYSAYCAIVAARGNIYFPEFIPSEASEIHSYKIIDLMELLQYHPVNQDWILPLIENLPNEEKFKLLRYSFGIKPDILAPILLKLYDQNAIRLDLYTALRLYREGNEDACRWLKERWDEIIYLCLIYDIDRKTRAGRLFDVLDDWPELKADLFQRCPAIRGEVEEQETYYEKRFADNDVQLTPAWKKTELLYQAALNGDEYAFKKLSWQGVERAYDEIPGSALATYFIGKLAPHNRRAFEHCLNTLKYSSFVWVEPEWQKINIFELESPVRHEAAFALSEFSTPVVWKAMVEAYFMVTTHDLRRFLRQCIARLTDQLSGDTPDSEALEIWGINRRPWFRVFTEPNPESQAMYAEYYGKPSADKQE